MEININQSAVDELDSLGGHLRKNGKILIKIKKRKKGYDVLVLDPSFANREGFKMVEIDGFIFFIDQNDEGKNFTINKGGRWLNVIVR